MSITDYDPYSGGTEVYDETESLLREFHIKAARCESREDMERFCRSFLKKHVESKYITYEKRLYKTLTPKPSSTTPDLPSDYTWEELSLEKRVSDYLSHRFSHGGLMTADQNYSETQIQNDFREMLTKEMEKRKAIKYDSFHEMSTMQTVYRATAIVGVPRK